MQMTPPSDSLGRTADVVPSKGHSPTAGPMQLLTQCYFCSGLWFTQWWQTPWLTWTSVTMTNWCPLKKEKWEASSTATTSRKFRKSYILILVADLGQSTGLSALNIKGDTAWKVENWLHFGPYLLLGQVSLCSTQRAKPYMAALPRTLRRLCFWVSSCCRIQNIISTVGSRDLLRNDDHVWVRKHLWWATFVWKVSPREGDNSCVKGAFFGRQEFGGWQGKDG